MFKSLSFAQLFLSIFFLTCSCSEIEPAKNEGDPLNVNVELLTDAGGTTHHAAKIEFTYEGKAPLTIVSDDEKGVIAPTPVKKIQLDATHYYLIGTSSPGGGMDRWHVLSIVVSPEKIELRQELVYSVARLSLGIVSSKEKPNRIGVVIPSDNPPASDDWELSMDGSKRSLGDLRNRPVKAANENDVNSYGSILKPSEKIRVLWYSLEGDGTFKENN